MLKSRSPSTCKLPVLFAHANAVDGIHVQNDMQLKQLWEVHAVLVITCDANQLVVQWEGDYQAI